MIEANHPLDDLLYKYTIDQLMLFYEKALVLNRRRLQQNTIAFAHCVPLALGGKEAANALDRFIKSLEPSRKSEEMKKETEKARRQAIGFLAGFGVQLKKP